jgi:hypothetical protein
MLLNCICKNNKQVVFWGDPDVVGEDDTDHITRAVFLSSLRAIGVVQCAYYCHKLEFRDCALQVLVQYRYDPSRYSPCTVSVSSVSPTPSLLRSCLPLGAYTPAYTSSLSIVETCPMTQDVLYAFNNRCIIIRPTTCTCTIVLYWMLDSACAHRPKVTKWGRIFSRGNGPILPASFGTFRELSPAVSRSAGVQVSSSVAPSLAWSSYLRRSRF